MAHRADRWIFESFALTPRSLGVARIIVASYLVLYRAPELGWIGSLPDTFFRPPAGPLRVANGIPSSGVFTVLSVGLSVATVALLIGYHTRIASCCAGLLLFALDGFTYSFGHIHHSGTYLAAVLVIMAASNWGAAYSVDSVRRRDGPEPMTEAWPLALAALLLGFLMLTSALPKLASGWLDPSTTAVRAHIAHYHVIAPHDGLLGTLPLHSTSNLIWKPFDYLTLLFEVGFVIAIASPRATRLFCATAVVFHFAIFLGFGIDFTASVVAYAVFFEWSAVIDRLRTPGTEPPASRAARELLWRRRAALGPAVLLAGVALYLLTDHFGAPIKRLAPRIVANPDQAATLLVFGVALAITLAYATFLTTCGAKRIRRSRLKPSPKQRVAAEP